MKQLLLWLATTSLAASLLNLILIYIGFRFPEFNLGISFLGPPYIPSFEQATSLGVISIAATVFAQVWFGAKGKE